MVDRIEFTGDKATDPDSGESFDLKDEVKEEQPVTAEDEEVSEDSADAEEAEETEEEESALPFSVEILGEMSAEYAEKGALSDERYAQLEKAGVGREVVDAVIQGQEALAEVQKLSAIMEADLTLSQYQQLAEWAGNNWSEDQVDTYNRLVDGADHGARQMAIKSLVAAAGGGRGPHKHGGLEGKMAKGGVVPFKSSDDMVQAMRDPKYKARQEPYFSEVKARLAAMQ